MGKLDPKRWQVIGPHLDKALGMSPPERATWLSEMEARDPQLAAELESLVNEHSALAEEGFLEEGPLISATTVLSPGITPTRSAPPVGSILGPYRLIRKLGEGGMGTVYEAMHQELGRRAAVKMLHRRYAESSQARTRFLREGQAASRIRHRNVADVYDVGTDGKHPYLVMEFLEGEDLSRLIAREAPLSAQRTADLVVPVVAAVAAAHDQGVVHRDLKPENIFLSAERNGIQPKVLDFGISKVIDAEGGPALTDTGAFLGTPHYVSPEQARGAKDIDFRSDQYSLGVILYECTTGRKPMEDPSIYTLVQKIVRGDFASPRQINSSLPTAFEDLILRAMARDAGDRFSTTAALGRALLEFAGAGVRNSYTDELANVSQSQQAPIDMTVAEKPVGARSTLTNSATAHDVLRTSKARRRWLGAGAVAFAGLVTVLLGRMRAPKAPPSAIPSALGELVAPAPERSAGAGVMPDPAADEPLHKTLVSDPPGAFVWRGGVAVGKTPMSVEIPANNHIEVELRLAGYEAYLRQISASDPEGSEVRIQLKPKRSPPRSTATGANPANRPELAPR